MHLYHLTLQRPTAVNAAVYGNFSAPKAHEVAAARGSVLELLRPDPETGRLETIFSTEAFGQVRSLAPLRLVGQTTDYLIVGSDSGKLVVLQYKKDANEFVRVHAETFGKTGARRITPGQYVARDPYGRAILVAATEKQKFVYVMNRDTENNLTISSPLEAHRAHTICFDVVGLDNGFNNPIFASLEVDYSDADADPTGSSLDTTPKLLTYYELDLGLNHVVRKWTRATDKGANLLMPVLGAPDGPGGVLIAAENWILYDHNTLTSAESEVLRVPIPRRTDMPDEKGLLIVSWAMHKMKTGFFYIAQSELGDLYKISLTVDPTTKKVTDISVKYFDTIPVSTSLCITRTGLLFAAAEFGNHCLYQFLSLGDDADDTGVVSHSIQLQQQQQQADGSGGGGGGTIEISCPVFAPRPLRNLGKIDESPSLAPITDAQIVVPSAAAVEMTSAGGSVLGAASVGLSVPQIAALCGRGSRSTLRVLRQGLAVTEVAVTPIPGSPMQVFTLKASESAIAAGGGGAGDATSASASIETHHPDKYIVLSFSTATLVLAVGDTVEEIPAKDIGFSDSVSTIAVGALVDGSYLQVYPGAMRMITWTNGVKGAAREWKPPVPRKIVRAAMNDRQVVLALSGGDLEYFEYDAATRSLASAGKKTLGAEVTALALGPVPQGRVRNPYLALADTNNMVRILNLDPADGKLLSQASAQALRASAESLALVNLRIHGPNPSLHLFIGLQNGVLSRLSVDASTGTLSDPRVRFLGVKPVKLVPISVGGAPALLALSTKPYLAYNVHGKYLFQALSYDTLVHAAPFTTAAVPEALVAIAGNTMRIALLDRLGDPFNAKTLPLRYTPRRMATHATSGLTVIVEADHNAYNQEERKIIAAAASEAHPEETALAVAALAAAAAAAGGGGGGEQETQEAMVVGAGGGGVIVVSGAVEEEGRDPLAEGIDVRRIGGPVPGSAGKWASCIRLVDLQAVSGNESSSIASTTSSHPAVHHILELEENEAALSVTTATFHDAPDEQFVLVGCVKDMQLHPRSARECSIHTYRVVVATESSGSSSTTTTSSSSSISSSTTARRTYQLQFVHKTPVEDITVALTPFLGRLLVGVGSTLRLYDMGKKRLLRKCEVPRGFPTLIQAIHTSLDRIFVCDAQESVHFVKYKRAENILVVFADDIMSRHMTSALVVLDHDSVMGADKFGNVFVLRVPSDISDDVDNPSGDRLIWDSAVLNGAPNKVTQVASFHVGAIVTSMHKAVLSAGGVEAVVYTTATGGAGAFVPLAQKDDVDFFSNLETHLRAEAVSLVGRDHASYRSSYAPVSHVVDGDLCEAYAKLAGDRQRALAGDLERTTNEILKKLEDARNKIT